MTQIAQLEGCRLLKFNRQVVLYSVLYALKSMYDKCSVVDVLSST